jgi:hypothetical protein
MAAANAASIPVMGGERRHHLGVGRRDLGRRRTGLQARPDAGFHQVGPRPFEVAQVSLGRIWPGRRGRLLLLGEADQDAGIERVGFGELAFAAAEGGGVEGIGDGHRLARLGQRGGHPVVIVTRGFEDDTGLPGGGEQGDQLGPAVRRVGQPVHLPRPADRHLKRALADVDPHKRIHDTTSWGEDVHWDP